MFGERHLRHVLLSYLCAALSGLRGQPQVDTDESQLRQEEAMTVRPPSADAQEYLENIMRGTGWDEAI